MIREWQDTRYVLANFGKAGASQGRKPELVGGSLIRSLGRWKEAKKLGLNKQDRIKGDERILVLTGEKY